MYLKRQNGWKLKYLEIQTITKGKITDPRHLKLGGDLDKPYGTFVFKTIYTDEGQEFGKQFDLFCESRHIHHTRFGPTTGKKTRLGIIERFNRTLRELYYDHIKAIPRENQNHYFITVDVSTQWNSLPGSSLRSRSSVSRMLQPSSKLRSRRRKLQNSAGN